MESGNGGEWNEWLDGSDWSDWEDWSPSDQAKRTFRYSKIDPVVYYRRKEFKKKFGFGKGNFLKIEKL